MLKIFGVEHSRYSEYSKLFQFFVLRVLLALEHMYRSYLQYSRYLGRQYSSLILSVLGVRKIPDTPGKLGVSSILGASVKCILKTVL